jgi:hypothetical protein
MAAVDQALFAPKLGDFILYAIVAAGFSLRFSTFIVIL